MIDIVIPVYNGLAFLKDCLTSIERNTTPGDWRVIIADDNSPDKEMKKFLKETTYQVIRNKWERGFPSNCSYAVSQTDGEFILLLNSDTLACSGWLESLADEMKDPKVAVAGSKLVFPQSKGRLAYRVQHAGVCRNSQGLPFHPFYGGDPYDDRVNTRRELNAVTFACALIRRKVWDELGGLDREFVGGQFEDVDFNWRVRKKGYKVIYQPMSMLYHFEHGAGIEFVTETEIRNRNLLLKKWGNLGSDEDLVRPLGLSLLETPEMREALAAFFHQIRSQDLVYAWAVPKTISSGEHRDHCLRLATMTYENLPEPEQQYVLQWADKFIERLKAYDNLSRHGNIQPRA